MLDVGYRSMADGEVSEVRKAHYCTFSSVRPSVSFITFPCSSFIASASVKSFSEDDVEEDLQAHGKAENEEREGDDPKWSEPATSNGFPYVSNIAPVRQEGFSTRGSSFWPLGSPEERSIRAVVSEKNEHGGWSSELKMHADDEADDNAAVREGDERRGGVEVGGGHVRPEDGMSRWQHSSGTDEDAESGPRLSREGESEGSEPETQDDLSRQSRRTADTEGEGGEEGEEEARDGGSAASRQPKKWAQEEAEAGEVSVKAGQRGFQLCQINVTHGLSPPCIPLPGPQRPPSSFQVPAFRTLPGYSPWRAPSIASTQWGGGSTMPPPAGSPGT